MEMVKIMSNCLTRGRVAKNLLLVLVFFILILTISPQNALAEENNQVNASEILLNISRGELVKYTNYVIIGDLDVRKIWKDLKIVEKEDIKWRVVESQIRIRDSTIQGGVNFNPIYFNNTIEFNNVTFEGRASFSYAVFTKQPDFQKSTFKEEADFGHANFSEGASFNSVKFNDAEFTDATFNNYANFGSATFDDDATFRNAIFVKEANFCNCAFNEFTNFFNATFNNLARFQWATFNGPVSFKNATFNDTANFPDVKFNDEAHFHNARFNDTTEFGFAKFKDRAYFTNASFENNADFSEADIFLTMKIRWSQLEGKLVYNDYFYQSLIRNFETLGLSNDTNDAYYKYKVEKRRHMPIFGLRRPLEFIFLDLSCGYGVKPLNPLGWAVFFIGVFAIFYWLIEVEGRWKRLHEHVKDKWKGSAEFLCGLIKGKENKKSRSDSSLKDRLKGLWVFLKDRCGRSLKFLFLSVSIFTTLGLLNNWKPAEKYKNCFRIGAIVEVFLGWLIMVLFIISLTMTWIR